MNYVFKICDQDLWDEALSVGRFTGAEIDLKDGFIHFSTLVQVPETLALHFSSRDGLLLLKVDISSLDIKWEPARSGDLFPHLYEDLPLAAVVSVLQLERGADGVHKLPTQL